MNRETKIIETPVSKLQVVLYMYLTGREVEFVQEPLMQSMSIRPSAVGADPQFGALDITKVQESTHRLLQKLVASIDGKTENLLDVILDMHQEDYEFIIAAVNELSKKK